MLKQGEIFFSLDENVMTQILGVNFYAGESGLFILLLWAKHEQQQVQSCVGAFEEEHAFTLVMPQK